MESRHGGASKVNPASYLSSVSDELSWDSVPGRECKILEKEGKQSGSMKRCPQGVSQAPAAASASICCDPTTLLPITLPLPSSLPRVISSSTICNTNWCPWDLKSH